MDKIVGDFGHYKVQKMRVVRAAFAYFFCMSFLFSFFLQAAQHEVSLALLSSEGEAVEQIAAGVPFQIAVTVSECRNTGVRPEIIGIEQFALRSTGFSMSSLNGKSTIKYLYTVSCDTPGDYLIGPAQLTLDGQKIQSDQVRVHIGERTVTNTPSAVSTQAAAPCFLRVQLDKDHLFVGEPVGCSLRLYTMRDGVSVQNITKPALPGFVQRETVEQSSGSEQIQGTRYAYHEWRWQLVPQEAGKKIIPAFCVDIEQPNSFHSLFAHMSAFIHMPGDHTRIYSDAVTVFIESLPPHAGELHVMGPVDSFQASVEPATAKEGEGLVLALRMAGAGDIAALDSFALQHMPEQLKWYDSKQYIVPPANSVSAQGQPATQSVNNPGTSPVKVFEYIVQGLAAGDYEIPAQTCTYFDLSTKTYKTIQTVPLSVTILGGAGSSFSQKRQGMLASAPVDALGGSDTPGTELTGTAAVAKSLAVGESLPLDSEGSWYTERRSLPRWLFLAIVVFFIFLGLARFVRMSSRWILARYRGSNNKKQILKNAHASIQKLSHAQRCAGVYPLFVSLVAALLEMKESEISDTVIEQALLKSGLSREQLSAWQLFFSQAAEFSFYASQASAREQESFFKSADLWIDLIVSRLGEK